MRVDLSRRLNSSKTMVLRLTVDWVKNDKL